MKFAKNYCVLFALVLLANFAWADDSEIIHWKERGVAIDVLPYDVSDSSETFNGRFWIFMNGSLSVEELNAMESMELELLETSRYQGRSLYLIKASIPISKKTLKSTLLGFYNAIAANDTTPLVVNPDDLYDYVCTCDEKGVCSYVKQELTVLDMAIYCWPDLSNDECENVVRSCGGDSAFSDFSVILAQVHRDSLHCLEKHKDVRALSVRQEDQLDDVSSGSQDGCGTKTWIKLQTINRQTAAPKNSCSYKINGARANKGSSNVIVKDGLPEIQMKWGW
ncbi:MAG: hypothetical protein IKS97_11140 [Fibrobacter sp.]|nr:hypothetical protein [Fibrobacter sp.]